MILVVSTNPDIDAVLVPYMTQGRDHKVVSWKDFDESILVSATRIVVDLPMDRLNDPRVQRIFSMNLEVIIKEDPKYMPQKEKKVLPSNVVCSLELPFCYRQAA